MNYILFDGPQRDHLLPLTFTRPVADLRIGITTIKEKWEYYLKTNLSYQTQKELSAKYPINHSKQNILINASFIPNEEILDMIQSLKENQMIVKEEEIIAFFTDSEQEIESEKFDKIEFKQEIIQIKRPYDLFKYNEIILKQDFKNITQNRVSQPIPEGVRVRNPENIFIEEGAQIEFAILNALEGPIYVGKNAKIQDGVLIRGGLALCEESQLNMGAKIYGATTIGPHCKIGGEVNNSVIFGYSNKGHEGFMGNSVIGEWCNWGADTNNSNLKNDYSEVKLWNYASQRFEKTGLQFCGTIMGDHSKAAINTQFNTGTVIGVSCNIFQSGFPNNFIPSFTWGKNEEYLLTKATQVAEKVMLRRGVEFNSFDKLIFGAIFDVTKDKRVK